MDLYDIITESQPEIRESSVKTYVSAAKRAWRLFFSKEADEAPEDLKWLDKSVTRRVQKLTAAQQRGVTPVLLILLRYKGSVDAYSELLRHYHDQKNVHRQALEQNELSQSEQKNWITWPEVTKLYSEMQREHHAQRLGRAPQRG